MLLFKDYLCEIFDLSQIPAAKAARFLIFISKKHFSSEGILKTAEVREAFLSFFESKGHQRVSSSSLVPGQDPTLMFSNAGMVQFKDVFLGTDPRPYTRATTCQKCLRISGKHNDLENVGRTARHHTFFEMLGNFSFGDYFKSDAISYAWEFVTKELGLPKEKLWVTVFEEDSEAENLWYSLTDVLKGRVVKRGKADNFWAMGETGPCGPCTEIFYFLGPDDYQQKGEELLADDPTYVEIWNLVFMQFNRSLDGAMTPLAKPSIDTGMGLERVAAVVQHQKANYDSDLLRAIINFVANLSGKTYLGKDYTERDVIKDPQYAVDVALRVIADHIRASVFLISEGVTPGSDGRSYIVRRLLRRACRHGRVLGLKESFLYKVVDSVVNEMKGAYPELLQTVSKVKIAIQEEEEKFLKTFDAGLAILDKEILQSEERKEKEFSGKAAFLLHDTFGFPLDLTEDILKSRGLSVDLDGFQAAMEEQRERSRSARASESIQIIQKSVKALPSKFVGYDKINAQSEVLGIFSEKGEVEIAREGDQLAVVVSETPFYAESGGQVGDTGRIHLVTGSLEVVDTQKAAGGTIAHLVRVVDGHVSKGDLVSLQVDEKRRKEIAQSHSATHVVHLALRKVLGDHVKQAGSRVSEFSLRFDFTHSKPISEKEVLEIFKFCNQYIQHNFEARTHVLPIEEAQKIGAVALFGEKYGDVVRVVELGEDSKEFCGGTHVTRLGDIGQIQFLSESSVSSGVRRIEATTGMRAFNFIAEVRSELDKTQELLHVPRDQVFAKVEKLLELNKGLEKMTVANAQNALQSKVPEIVSKATKGNNGVPVTWSLEDGISVEQLRSLADDVRDRLGSGVVILGSAFEDKGHLLVAVTKDLSQKVNAGSIVKEILPMFEGRGGGKPDLAQAGGDPTKLNAVIQHLVSSLL